jgi:FkbM family methyltransferase
LDVGGHVGETLAEVVKPCWRFDRVFTFEPASVNLPALERIADDRVEIVAAGWWHEDTELDLHDPGAIGASVAAEKALTAQVEICSFIDAAVWLQENVAPDDTVWAKLNCEGAECGVIDHLDDAGALELIDHLLVHFDVEKIPGHEHQAPVTRRRLDQSDVEWIEANRIMFGRSHAAKTANWIRWTEAGMLAKWRYRHLARLAFRARQRLYPVKQAIRRLDADRFGVRPG